LCIAVGNLDLSSPLFRGLCAQGSQENEYTQIASLEHGIRGEPQRVDMGGNGCPRVNTAEEEKR